MRPFVLAVTAAVIVAALVDITRQHGTLSTDPGDRSDVTATVIGLSITADLFVLIVAAFVAGGALFLLP